VRLPSGDREPEVELRRRHRLALPGRQRLLALTSYRRPSDRATAYDPAVTAGAVP
jgi:hypothetical protein